MISKILRFQYVDFFFSFFFENEKYFVYLENKHKKRCSILFELFWYHWSAEGSDAYTLQHCCKSCAIEVFNAKDYNWTVNAIASTIFSRFTSKSGDYTLFTPTKNEPYISMFPYFHVGGLVYAGLMMLKEGAINVVVPKYDQRNFVKLIEQYKVMYLLLTHLNVNQV